MLQKVRETAEILFDEIQKRSGGVLSKGTQGTKCAGPCIPVSVVVDIETGSSVHEDFLWRMDGVSVTLRLHSLSGPLCKQLG
jgi:hypothetical protein